MIDAVFPELEALQSFEDISLREMDEVRLMNRTDTKFVLSRYLLNELFSELSGAYRVLDVMGSRISRYKTLYFDTAGLNFYLDYHNGRLSRYKVRIRNYVESDLHFLEIKHKYKGRTVKKRIKIDDFELALKPLSVNYINEVVGKEMSLQSKLWNSFGRITLVNKTEKERLTIDLNLSFEWRDETKSFEEVVVAELKQENVNRNSSFYSLMKKHNIRPTGMSKYCLGTFTMDPTVKWNNFKPKVLLINKLERA